MFSKRSNFENLLIKELTLLAKKFLDIKKEMEAPIKAAMKTTIDPTEVPYKNPAKIESQDAGKMNITEIT